jgi:hypothetical protein
VGKAAIPLLRVFCEAKVNLADVSSQSRRFDTGVKIAAALAYCHRDAYD